MFHDNECVCGEVTAFNMLLTRTINDRRHVNMMHVCFHEEFDFGALSMFQQFVTTIVTVFFVT